MDLCPTSASSALWPWKMDLCPTSASSALRPRPMDPCRMLNILPSPSPMRFAAKSSAATTQRAAILRQSQTYADTLQDSNSKYWPASTVRVGEPHWPKPRRLRSQHVNSSAHKRGALEEADSIEKQNQQQDCSNMAFNDQPFWCGHSYKMGRSEPKSSILWDFKAKLISQVISSLTKTGMFWTLKPSNTSLQVHSENIWRQSCPSMELATGCCSTSTQQRQSFKRSAFCVRMIYVSLHLHTWIHSNLSFHFFMFSLLFKTQLNFAKTKSPGSVLSALTSEVVGPKLLAP